MKVNLPNPNDENALESIQIDKWDTWSMDYTLSLLIVPMLKQLKEDSHGYPATLNSFEEWQGILDKMIWSFEQAKNEYEGCYGLALNNNEEYKAYMNQIQQGFDLFGKYYMSLWD